MNDIGIDYYLANIFFKTLIKAGDKVQHEPELTRSSKICKALLLWGDVIDLLGCCLCKNFVVLLWFAIIAFRRVIVYKSNLVIFRYELAI